MKKLVIRLSLFGAITGLIAGVLATLFRLSVDISQHLFLPDGEIGNYEALPAWLRFSLPVLGALILGIIFEKLSPEKRQVGIVHVLEFLRYRKSKLPLSNAVVQFFGGLIAIVSGHSVDREGPAVHLGAASAALLGRKMSISDNEYYLLAAAGGAAAIAAAFNTPLAAVIFVIEVLRVRYAVGHLMTVIVATVTGTVISRLVFGNEPIFDVPTISIGSLTELPLVMLMGILIGFIATGFIRSVGFTARRTRNLRPLFAFLLCGVITGLLAQWSPAIMGISYDAINRILLNDVGIQALVLLVIAKFIATTISIGARIPGGLIGPSLLLGGAIGGLIEILVSDWYPFYQGTTGFYAMIGMVAMMGAILRAPLAALVALMELTGNVNIILPGMIAVVSAEMTKRAVIGDLSAFTHLLKIKRDQEAN